MSISDAVVRIGEINSRLLQVSGVATEATTTATTSTDTSSESTSALFAQMMSALGGSSATSSTGIANPLGATGTDVVASASKYIGVPYVLGGEDSSGMDCSGLVQRVYADMGIEVPRLVSGQMTIGTEVASIAEAQPGDLIVTGGGEHILIYAGNNKVIHAPYEGRTVSLVDAYMTDGDIDTIRRVIPTATTAGASTSISAASSNADLVSAALAALVKGGAS